MIRYAPVTYDDPKDFNELVEGHLYLEKYRPDVPHFVIAITKISFDPTYSHERPRPSILVRFARAVRIGWREFRRVLPTGRPLWLSN